MMVCLCLWGFTYQAHAQWTVAKYVWSSHIGPRQ